MGARDRSSLFRDRKPGWPPNFNPRPAPRPKARIQNCRQVTIQWSILPHQREANPGLYPVRGGVNCRCLWFVLLVEINSANWLLAASCWTSVMEAAAAFGSILLN